MVTKRLLNNGDEEIGELLKKVSPRVAFQPIVDTCSAGIMGFEAIANEPDPEFTENLWESFNKSVCNSDEVLFRLDMAFIELAVKSSKALTHEYKLFINVRDYSLDRISSCPDYFMIFLESLDINPSRAVIEISECIDQDYIKFISGNIQELQEKGIKIAIDKVGQNYAGLLHIDYIQPDYIKLDSSLIDDIDTDVDKQHLVLGLSALAEKMNVPIIAMGIESNDIIKSVNRLGVSFAQWSMQIHPLMADKCLGRLKSKKVKPTHTNVTHGPGNPTTLTPSFSGAYSSRT